MIKRAIVRSISPNYKACVSDHPQIANLSLEKANDQHDGYINLLENLGLDVIQLEPLTEYPDCCFVEDTAVIQNGKAMITAMGEPSRRGEVETIAEVLQDYFPTKLMDKGHLEGGDVMHFADHMICGITQRTDRTGVNSLQEYIGQPVYTIEDPSIVHLKSYMTPIDDYTVLVTKIFADHPVLENYHKIVVPQGEEYAANVLNINGVVLVPRGYRHTKLAFIETDYDVISLEMTEFEKCEGALSCLSLLF